MEKMKNKKGITLIALVVTIVIILILAGITVGMVTSDNGILKETKNAKEQAEIDSEKSIVERARMLTIMRDKSGKVTLAVFEPALKSEAGTNPTEVSDAGDVIEILFTDTYRYYEVDKDGNVSEPKKVVKDENAGDITKGGKCDGSEEKPYEINCIEDLCDFSNMVNINLNSNKYVVLKRDLNFNSRFSYVNGNIKTDGKIKSCNSIDELKTALTTGEGFYNISQDQENGLRGVVFDGQYHTISNLYENYEDSKAGGLFAYCSWGSKILNLTVTGNIKSKAKTGGIAGVVRQVELINCINKCNILTNGSSTGGIAGNTYNESSKFINCINYGDVSGHGILGWDWANTSKFYNCINAGDASESATISSIYENSEIEMINILNYGKTNTFFSCRAESGVAKTINCYSVKERIESKVKSDIKDATQYSWYSQIEEKDEENVKSQDFIDNMNNFITNDAKAQSIDTTGWAKWIIGTNGYPTLAFQTTWNGTEWENL
mgnify:CR=1 FL=1